MLCLQQMVAELDLAEMLNIFEANDWKPSTDKVRKNKIPMVHADKQFPDNYVILHFPHPGSYYRQDQVRYLLSEAGISWQQALSALQ